MSRRLALCLLLALLGPGACGDGGPEAPSAASTAGPALDVRIDPIPLGTPGSRDPSHLAEPDGSVQFVRGDLVVEGVDLADPTTLAFGPDGRLYVGQLSGQLLALTLEGQAVTDVQVLSPPGVLGNVLGLAFSPADRPEPLTLYVSHTRLYAGDDGPPFAGTVSKLVAPSFAPVPVVTGLPVSTMEHGTNGLAFDRAGRLYIAQGGTSNAGVPSERHPRPDTPLSGAVLLADLTDPAFDGRIRYQPPDVASPTTDLVGGDVRVYASGFRNPYDLLVHSNGRIYATDNGPNTPDGLLSLTCTEAGGEPSAPDELNLVLEGRYYGHPNRNRGRLDERQCTFYAADDGSGVSTPPIATLGYNVSANGIVEYMTPAFGGRLRGDLIYVEWVTGRVWRVQLTPDGTAVAAVSQLVPGKLQRPLDVTVGPDGTVYIAEMGADRIAYLTPAGLSP